jgi:hypothetical protein
MANDEGTNGGSAEDPKIGANKAKLAENLELLQKTLKTQKEMQKVLSDLGVAEQDLANQRVENAKNQDALETKSQALTRKIEKIEKSKGSKKQKEDKINALKKERRGYDKQIDKLKEVETAIENLLKLNEKYGIDSEQSFEKQRKSIEDTSESMNALKSFFNSLGDEMAGVSQVGGRLGGVFGNMSEKSKAMGGSINVGTFEKLGEAMSKVDFLGDLPGIGKYFKAFKKVVDLGKNMPQTIEKMQKFYKVAQKIPGVGRLITSLVGGLGSLATTVGGFFGGGAILGAAVILGVVLAIAAVVYVIYRLMKAMFKLADEVDTTSKAIGKATGFANEFHEQIVDAQMATVAAGVGMKELQDAAISLANGFSKYDQKNAAVNSSLMTTVSLLSKLGVSSSESVKLMDHFSRAMGMSEQASADMTANLALLGKEMGVTSKKMVSDFSGASGRLAMYGNDNIKVFKELEAQIKSTGLEMNTLLNISQQYDSFDKAAESAAQLNAVLGTQLSSLELLNATDSERITMIKEQVSLSVGSNFDSLDKFTKRHIAEAMGLKDVAEAQRLLNMEQSEYRKYINGTANDVANPQKELANMAESFVTLKDAISNAWRTILYSMGPAIETLSLLVKSLADTIVSVSKSYGQSGLATIAFGGIIRVLSMIIANLISVLKVLGMAYDAVGKVTKPFADALNYVNDAFVDFFDILHLAGSPVLWMMPGVVAAGFEMAGNAAKFFGDMLQWPVKALGFLWDIFHKPGSDMLYELPNYFAGALGAAGGAAKTMAAFLLSPVSMLLSFAESFISIKDTIAEIVTGMTSFVSVIKEFAALDFDGFIAVRSEGGATSMVMGSEGILKQMSEGKLQVDVNMPEIKLPEINIEVVFMDEKLTGIIDARIAEKVGNSG